MSGRPPHRFGLPTSPGRVALGSAVPTCKFRFKAAHLHVVSCRLGSTVQRCPPYWVRSPFRFQHLPHIPRSLNHSFDLLPVQNHPTRSGHPSRLEPPVPTIHTTYACLQFVGIVLRANPPNQVGLFGSTRSSGYLAQPSGSLVHACPNLQLALLFSWLALR